MGQELEMSPESTIDEYVQGVGLVSYRLSFSKSFFQFELTFYSVELQYLRRGPMGLSGS